jgi:hypothetical protein
MGFFGKILEKLGLKKDAEKAAPVKPAAPTVKPMTAPPAEKPKPAASVAAPAKPAASAAPAAAAAPAEPVFTPTANFHPNAISEVDVVKQLETLSVGSGLDWKVSIVDLLKLLEIDSSREARNELATELGCPADLMHDSAKMNVWLHKEVLKQIAKNGGNIPANLLD